MLTLHFLNVGHGDCTFVEFPSGRLAMIDINNTKSLPGEDVDALAEAKGLSAWEFKMARLVEGKRSWDEYYKSLLADPYDYYCDKLQGRSIFRYIQTHPDMDHMSGLNRFFWQEKVPFGCFWDVAHAKECDEESFDNSPYSYLDWLVYELLRNGRGPDDSGHKVIKNLRGAAGNYWTDDDIQILSPTKELVESCNSKESFNDCSYVLKISYAGRNVILPGDAESSSWESILDQYGNASLKCDILKASHHGRKSGYDEEAVDAMSPDVVICSVGKKPSTDASTQYASHGAKVISTRYHGTITVKIWYDGDIWVEDCNGDRIHTII